MNTSINNTLLLTCAYIYTQGMMLKMTEDPDLDR